MLLAQVEPLGFTNGKIAIAHLLMYLNGTPLSELDQFAVEQRIGRDIFDVVRLFMYSRRNI